MQTDFLAIFDLRLTHRRPCEQKIRSGGHEARETTLEKVTLKSGCRLVTFGVSVCVRERDTHTHRELVWSRAEALGW